MSGIGGRREEVNSRREERRLTEEEGEEEKRLRTAKEGEGKEKKKKAQTRLDSQQFGGSALDNLGHFCHCISIRTAETPHLPFISFPFQHLQAICILSVLPLLFMSPHATTFPE